MRNRGESESLQNVIQRLGKLNSLLACRYMHVDAKCCANLDSYAVEQVMFYRLYAAQPERLFGRPRIRNAENDASREPCDEER